MNRNKIKKIFFIMMALALLCVVGSSAIYAQDISGVKTIELKKNTHKDTKYIRPYISNTIKGNLSQHHKEELYRFSVTQEGRMTVLTDVRKKYEDKSKYAVMKYQILDENKKPVDHWFYVQGDAWGTDDQSVEFYFKDPGTYYLQVAYRDFKEVIGRKKVALPKNQENEVTYDFIITFRPSKYREQNCIFKNGSIVREKNDKALMFDSDIFSLGYGVVSEGRYRIDIPRDGNLTIHVRDVSGGYFKVYRKNGKLIKYLFQEDFTAANSDMWRAKTQISLKKGSYYLEVTKQGLGFSGIFSVSYSDGPLQTCRLKKTAADTITVKAKAAGGLKGYEIRYKEGTFGKWKNVTVSGNKNLSKSLNGLKKGVTYTVQIRTYCSGEYKKQYSKWSDKMKLVL